MVAQCKPDMAAASTPLSGLLLTAVSGVLPCHALDKAYLLRAQSPVSGAPGMWQDAEKVEHLGRKLDH